MKKNFLIPVFCLFLMGAVFPLIVQAETDLIGTWIGPALMEGQPENVLTLVLEKKEGKLTGTLTGEYGTLNDALLENINVEGNILTFETMVAAGGGDLQIAFKITVTGNAMAGEFDIPDVGMTGTWEAEKQKD